MAAPENQEMAQVIRRVVKMQIAPVENATEEVSAESSLFNHVEKLPPDAIFHTKARFKADPDPRKINLGIGAYRTDQGKPYVLQVVRNVEAELLVDPTLNKEYLPIGGDAEFVAASQYLMFGDCDAVSEGRIAGVQTLSGTGALRILANFLKNNFPGITIYKSSPSWGNHRKIFLKAGLNQGDYRYWDARTRGLDYEGMLEDLRNAPNGSAVLLHACAHNPTGVDPTQEQWQGIMEVMKEKNHLTFFDSAYQGYASGSLDNDAFAVRLFVSNGMEVLLAQSFSKNLGLYGERVGCASVLCASVQTKQAVDTQLRAIVRPMYSNPPKHGCYIAKRVMNNPVRFAEWVQELEGMSGRILEMRSMLREALERKGTPGSWNHITDQIGMFSFTGLTPQQVEYIEKTYHVYMLKSGRISMAGVSSSGVDYIAEAMYQAITNVN